MFLLVVIFLILKLIISLYLFIYLFTAVINTTLLPIFPNRCHEHNSITGADSRHLTPESYSPYRYPQQHCSAKAES
jgi:hypothetical protein